VLACASLMSWGSLAVAGELIEAELALPGTAKASPDAHANACNTAIRTDLLIVLMHPSLVV